MTLPPLIRREKKSDTRLRSAKHRAFVRRHHCIVPGCTNLPTECAHVRLGTDGAGAIKPSDQFSVAMCLHHHSAQHAYGEREFERISGLDLRALAEQFASHSPDPAIRQAAKAARVREIE